MKKRFCPVGLLSLVFDGGHEIKTFGRDVVSTDVEIEFDDEEAKNNSVLVMRCLEIENGVVMETRMTMPPIIQYYFEDYFAVKDNQFIERMNEERENDEGYEKREKKVTGQWKFQKK